MLGTIWLRVTAEIDSWRSKCVKTTNPTYLDPKDQNKKHTHTHMQHTHEHQQRNPPQQRSHKQIHQHQTHYCKQNGDLRICFTQTLEFKRPLIATLNQHVFIECRGSPCPQTHNFPTPERIGLRQRPILFFWLGLD